MATLHFSEADMLRDPAALLASVRAGHDVLIDGEDSTVAILRPAVAHVEEPEPGYDEWFRASVQEAIDGDPATDIDGDVVERYFAERRRLTRESLQSLVG